jgi:hypothetical protein
MHVKTNKIDICTSSLEMVKELEINFQLLLLIFVQIIDGILYRTCVFIHIMKNALGQHILTWVTVGNWALKVSSQCES